MKYVLVDKYDNIVDSKDLASDIGVQGATTYFVKRKQISYENFIQIWRVMTEQRYYEISESATRKSSEGEFGDCLDYEKS
jgi:hypothetical protein